MISCNPAVGAGRTASVPIADAMTSIRRLPVLKRPALGLIAGSAFITLALATPVAAATAPIAVTTPVASALTAAYASYRHIPASSVAGVRPGTLRTSYDAATRTHWATAGFFPSSTAGAT